MTPSKEVAETGTMIALKVSPPISVSLATVYGIQVHEVVMWVTLIYTLVMLLYKLYSIVVESKERSKVAQWRQEWRERRLGAPDSRPFRLDRRGTNQPPDFDPADPDSVLPGDTPATYPPIVPPPPPAKRKRLKAVRDWWSNRHPGGAA